MAEILIKTLTRHRDQSDPNYLKDWTAGDVCQIMPDGFFTKNKYRGAKRMGIVLLVDAELPKEFAGEVKYDPNDKTKLLSRVDLCVDLRKILTDEQIKDCFNHEVLVDPIRINKSYLDLFVPREERNILDVYDKSGSFASGTVDVGPNGHSDANTFFECESNIANLTGVLTCNTDEGGWNDSARIALYGFTTSAANYLVFSASGAGRHTGKWNTGAHYISAASLNPITNNIPFMRFKGLQVTSTLTTSNWPINLVMAYSAAAEQVIDGCIVKGNTPSTGYSCWGIYVESTANWTAGSVIYVNNTIIYGCKGDAGGRGIYQGEGDVTLYGNNLTVYDCTYGIQRAAGTVTLRNCAIGNCGDDLTGTIGMNYMVTDDDHDADCANWWSYPTAGTGNWSSDYTDAANADFSLKATATNLIDRGTDDPGGALQDDIDVSGAAWASPWDIGASRYAAASTSIIPLQMFDQRQRRN